MASEQIAHIRSFTKEKIMLQTDKSIYSVNDRIWFKVFIVDSVSERLAIVKNILYVDLVDEYDRSVSQFFLHGNHTLSGGAITLPDSLNSGYYWLRAYTHFDTLSGKSNMSVRPLLLINPNMPHPVVKKSWHPTVRDSVNFSKPTVEIFPEGGFLMSGENNLVVIKYQDHLARAVSDSGLISDRSGKTVFSFAFNPGGYAKFRFSPTPRGRYNLYIKNGARFDSLTVMPKVDFHAAQLSVEAQLAQAIKLKVLLEDSLFNSNYSTYIIGINKGSLCFASVGQGNYEVNLPITAFPSGVAHLLLFNEKGGLLSQRDVFIPQQRPQITLTGLKDHYGPREKVDLDIQINDADSKPDPATLTISVTDARLTETSNLFFQDSLMMDSLEDIDLLMLTGKGRGAKSVNPLADLSTDSGRAFNPFIFSGRVVNKKTQPLADYEISLVSTSRGLLVLQDTSKASGIISIRIPEFNDSLDFEFKGKRLKGSTEEFQILADLKRFPSLITPAELKNHWSLEVQAGNKKMEKFQSDTLLSHKSELLPEIIVSGKKPRSTMNLANPSNIITRAQLQAGGVDNVANTMYMIPGVRTSNGFLVIRGVTSFAPSASNEPIVVLDGSQVDLSGSGDAQESSPVMAYLRSLNARDIEYIKVLGGTDASEYGSRGGHGVIEIHTSTTDYTTQVALPGRKFLMVGFRTPHPFEPRDYGNKLQSNSKIPDYRTTLYWGSFDTDKSGSVKIIFYTGDALADYIITIAGITIKGEKIYKRVHLKM